MDSGIRPRAARKQKPLQENTNIHCNTITEADLNEAENFNNKPRDELGGVMSLSDLGGV